jgi:hypothetical protein
VCVSSAPPDPTETANERKYTHPLHYPVSPTRPGGWSSPQRDRDHPASAPPAVHHHLDVGAVGEQFRDLRVQVSAGTVQDQYVPLSFLLLPLLPQSFFSYQTTCRDLCVNKPSCSIHQPHR